MSTVKTLSIAAASLVAAVLSTSAFAASDEYTMNQNLPVAQASGVSRADVRAVTASAIRAGAVQFDEYSLNQFPKAVAPSALQRAQVIAEAVEARKLGLISEGDVQAEPTAAQIEQIRLAGQLAVQQHVAAK